MVSTSSVYRSLPLALHNLDMCCTMFPFRSSYRNDPRSRCKTSNSFVYLQLQPNLSYYFSSTLNALFHSCRMLFLVYSSNASIGKRPNFHQAKPIPNLPSMICIIAGTQCNTMRDQENKQAIDIKCHHLTTMHHSIFATQVIAQLIPF